MAEEEKIPVQLCTDLDGNVRWFDVGKCKRSYISHFLGLSPKWKPMWECGDDKNTHFCEELTSDQIKELYSALHRSGSSDYSLVEIDKPQADRCKYYQYHPHPPPY